MRPFSGAPLTHAGATDRGYVREVNEDAYVCCEERPLYVVSDGMGGHEGGEVAAGMVVKYAPIDFNESYSEDLDEEGVLSLLSRVVSQTNDRIHDRARHTQALHEMGATIVACFIRGGTAFIAHLGDSRAYLLRDGSLERLTEDHGLADLLVRQGSLAPEDARQHPSAHILTRYMGMDAPALPTLGVLDLQEGDCLLLCSDGLTKMVEDEVVGGVLLGASTPSDAAWELIDVANEAGGNDNTTTIVLQCGPRAETPVEALEVRAGIGVSLRVQRGTPEARF